MRRMVRVMTILAATLVVAGGCSEGEPAEGDPANADAGDTDAGDNGDTALSLESIYPVSGSSQGGEETSLYGTGFADGATVRFGADEAQTEFVSHTELDAVTPGAEPGSVDVIVENPDGETATLEDGFEYLADDEDPLEIGWCNLQSPPSTTTVVGAETEPIFGRVYIEGCTDTDGDCPEVDAELGWGAADADPSLEPAGWEWLDAERNAQFDDENDHEYQASITADEEGEFAYAYRFSVEDSEWTYCDLTGSDDGFDTGEMGELVVEDASVEIGWCNLQYPASTTVDVGEETELIFGRVYVQDCTGAGMECEQVSGQVGFGPDDTDPSAAPGDYQWEDAEYNTGYPEDGSTNNDEHMATVTPTADGTFGYLFRFSGDGGDSWTYCDLNGSDDGFAPDEMGTLTVDP